MFYDKIDGYSFSSSRLHLNFASAVKWLGGGGEEETLPCLTIGLKGELSA